jgi:hypothetical protein
MNGTLPNVILAGGKQMKEIAGTQTEKKVDETVKANNKNIINPESAEAKGQYPVAKVVSSRKKKGKNVSSVIHSIAGML